MQTFGPESLDGSPNGAQCDGHDCLIGSFLLTYNPSTHLSPGASSDSVGSDPLADLDSFADVAFLRRRVKCGEAAFRLGDSCSEIYAVRSGFFKATNIHAMGREQVVGFFMRGEIFGLDGIGSGSYNCTAVALEDSEIVVLPFALLQDMARRNPAMQLQLHQVLSQEIARDHGMMLLLGSMHSRARVASFLVNLSARFAQRGYSRSDIVLRMTREDIGSYLGLKLETVSRILSEFKKSGLMTVQQKHIFVLDPEGLRQKVRGA